MLPEDVKVEWIGNEEEVHKLTVLSGEPMLGIDVEWIPSILDFQITKPAIFQISGAKTVFLIDLAALSSSGVLNAAMTSLFSNEETLVIGFD